MCGQRKGQASALQYESIEVQKQVMLQCKNIALLETPHRTGHESRRRADLLYEACAEIQLGDGQGKG